MAGHSKWANIKHKKERADAKKGKAFSRIAKEIISAVKIGGADPKANPRLRLALQKAKAANVPNDVVDRNIKKAASADQANYDELTYELYGHGGVGIIVEAMTDNKNRTASDMRIATNKRGGSIASPGSVAFNFDRKGVIQVQRNGVVEEELFLLATEAGAEDFEVEEDCYIITTDPSDLYNVKDAIEMQEVPCEDASLEMIPKTTITCDEETKQANEALIEWLENIDDVDEVYHNMEE
ncbi:MAG: YebC/PmpR family DNA-binding transcriptional regulator [Chlamydiales bacterium]|nr:YebC/PmpR family DNA-binding transcriptional regulator [Chlamydiia bacterium]MCP5508550.1 YebC/PmpR family DNA-binding transcriptional regulator [Chlamydiales bacterium]